MPNHPIVEKRSPSMESREAAGTVPAVRDNPPIIDQGSAEELTLDNPNGSREENFGENLLWI